MRINSVPVGKLGIIVLFGVCLFGQAANLLAAVPKTFYVATNGNDSNSGTINSPFRTVQHAADVAACGDTVNIRSGTYNGGMGVTYGKQATCSSYSNAVTVQAYSIDGGLTHETVTMISVGGQGIIGFATDSYPVERDIYWIVNNIIFDGATLPPTGSIFPGNKANHIRFNNVEIKNAPGAGANNSCNYLELNNLSVHDNGFDRSGPVGTRGNHGLYLTGHHNVIDGGSFYSNGMYGIQIFDSGQTSVNDNVVRNARIYNNGSIPGGGGLILSTGYRNVAYNNLIYGNSGSALSIAGSGFCGDCALYNNTIYGNSGYGILIGSAGFGSLRGTVKNNIAYGNSAVGIEDEGQLSAISNNFTGDPKFTNAAARDFTLQATSGAIDAGVDLRSIFTTDFAGNSRPSGAAFDIGAYERGSSISATDTTPPIVSLSVGSLQ